jgi:hypothetical protein
LEGGGEVNIIAVLPAPDWVCESLDDNGTTKSVYPCVGWAVDSDGEIHVLPFSLGDRWTTRPKCGSDDARISSTGTRLMQRPAVQPFGDSLLWDGRWVDNAT